MSMLAFTLEGPHDDLYDLYYEADIDQNLSDTIDRMLGADEGSARIEAARDILRQREDCGLAYAVLAREGASDIEECKSYYARAIDLIRQECARHEPVLVDFEEEPEGEIYFLNMGALPLISAEYARLICRQGDREAALALVLSVMDKCDDENLGLRFLAASWMIQRGQDAGARAIIEEKLEDTAEWYFMYALLLYRELGDVPVSRAAARRALLEGPAVAGLLLAQSLDNDPSDGLPSCANEDEEDDDEEMDVRQFVTDTRCAWHTSTGSLKWFKEGIDYAVGDFARYTGHSAGSTQTDTSGKMKRWRSTFDIAQCFFNRADYREARRLLRTAIREVERFGALSWQFLASVDALRVVLLKLKEPLDEIVTIYERHASYIQTICTDDPVVKAYCYWSIAGRIWRCGEPERAERWFVETVELYEQLFSDGNPAMTMCDVSRVLLEAGQFMGEQRRYKEALPLLRRSLDLHEQFLGKMHPDLIIGADYLARCLHHVGRHAEEAALRQRMVSDLHYDGESEEHSDDGSGDCPWCVSNCETDETQENEIPVVNSEESVVSVCSVSIQEFIPVSVARL